MKLEPRISYEDWLDELMQEEQRRKEALAKFYASRSRISPMVLSFALVGLVVSIFIVLALVFGK
jgi:hypothetical protein